MRIKYLPAIVALVLCTPSFGADKAEFVKQATEASDFEIRSGRLALAKGETLQVKVFAQKMILDHTAAAQKLEKVAAAAGIPTENQPIKLTETHMEDMEELQTAGPGQFDPVYVDIQRKAHESVIKLFSEYAESGDDPKLKQFAAETLPTLQSHLDHVKALTVSKT